MTRDNLTTRAALRRAAFACAATVAALLFGGAVTPAAAQSCPAEAATVCGFVWDDANHNGVQDSGENGIEDVKVSFEVTNPDGTTEVVGETTTGACTGATASADTCGVYRIQLPDGTYTAIIQTSTVGTAGTVATTSDAPNPDGDAADSDGVDDTFGNSIVKNLVIEFQQVVDKDFGFYTPPAATLQPGTGTPGYWKNHPGDWPVDSITIGGVSYSKTVAIAWLGKVGKDKTTTIFASLVSAKLNVLIGNSNSCISSTIGLADAWMAVHKVGTNVAGSSAAWAEAEPLHQQMDAYNNGLLCAPHRN